MIIITGMLHCDRREVCKIVGEDPSCRKGSSGTVPPQVTASTNNHHGDQGLLHSVTLTSPCFDILLLKTSFGSVDSTHISAFSVDL